MPRPRRNSQVRKAAPVKRRRMRAPPLVILRLQSDLAANDRHPLAQLDPETRNERRQQLIASILARIANGPVQNQLPTDPLPAAPLVESGKAR